MNAKVLSTTGASLEDETDEEVLAILDDVLLETEELLEVLSSLVVDDVLTEDVSIDVVLDSTLDVDSTVLDGVLSIDVLVLAVELQAIKNAALTSVKTLISFIMMVSFSTLDVLIVLSKHRKYYNE